MARKNEELQEDMPMEADAAPESVPEEAMAGMPGDSGVPIPGPAIPASAAAMYPSADPAFIGNIISQILAAQQADHQKLAMDQQSALMNNPILQALLMGPQAVAGMEGAVGQPMPEEIDMQEGQ